MNALKTNSKKTNLMWENKKVVGVLVCILYDIYLYKINKYLLNITFIKVEFSKTIIYTLDGYP